MYARLRCLTARSPTVHLSTSRVMDEWVLSIGGMITISPITTLIRPALGLNPGFLHEKAVTNCLLIRILEQMSDSKHHT
jgi:hypothetical protein